MEIAFAELGLICDRPIFAEFTEKAKCLDKSDDGGMSTNQSFNMDQSFCF